MISASRERSAGKAVDPLGMSAVRRRNASTSTASAFVGGFGSPGGIVKIRSSSRRRSLPFHESRNWEPARASVRCRRDRRRDTSSTGRSRSSHRPPPVRRVYTPALVVSGLRRTDAGSASSRTLRELRAAAPRRRLCLAASRPGKTDDRLGIGRGCVAPAAASCRRRALLPTTGAAAARWDPSITRRSVLNHARVGADDVAVQVLRARVAEVLAVLQRRVVHLDDGVLIPRIVLRPPGEARRDRCCQG